eukprot:m.25495 g.25495  ORF g.25495 m.25495 type:complete len:299 (+) comp13185_c1_seq1:141-1037(+)
MGTSNPPRREWQPPPTIESLFHATEGNKFAGFNRPISGALSEDPVEVGSAPIQLYSLATPNGQKVGILLEELGVEYDAHVIRLQGDQFKKGFVEVNPNSKIPALLDRDPISIDGTTGEIRLFESGSIMLYLAEKYQRFIPRSHAHRAQMLNWVFWQMAGQGPMTGNYGHFFVYAPSNQVETRDYGVARYGMEVQRLCSVLDQHLNGRDYLVGDGRGEYTIADMICLPWFHVLRYGYNHESGVQTVDFLNPSQYKNLTRWADALLLRPQVQRGLRVCRKYGKPWLVGYDHKRDVNKPKL